MSLLEKIENRAVINREDIIHQQSCLGKKCGNQRHWGFVRRSFESSKLKGLEKLRIVVHSIQKVVQGQQDRLIKLSIDLKLAQESIGLGVRHCRMRLNQLGGQQLPSKTPIDSSYACGGKYDERCYTLYDLLEEQGAEENHGG